MAVVTRVAGAVEQLAWDGVAISAGTILPTPASRLRRLAS